MMNKRLEGKVAIITGAGTGIGEAVAHKFAREGAQVVVNSLPEDPVEDVANALRKQGSEAVAYVGDVSDEGHAIQCVQAAINTFGKLDILVNNAGVHYGDAEIDQFPVDKFDRITTNNIRSVFLMTKYALPHLRRTRGVLLDIASYKGVRTLQGGQVITVADLEGACRQQGVQIERGDVVLLHTGWMEAMSSDTLRYYNSQPGPGRSGAEYLAAKGIVALGSDTPRVDVVPFETPQEFFPVHQTLLAKNGVYLLESINTSALARDGVHEFLFVLGQPRFTGASQSIINPLAIR